MNVYQVVCSARELKRLYRWYEYSESAARVHLHAAMTFRAQLQYAKSFCHPKLFIDPTKPFCCHVGGMRLRKTDCQSACTWLWCRFNRTMIRLRKFAFRCEPRWHLRLRTMLKVKPITVRHQSCEKLPTAEHQWKSIHESRYAVLSTVSPSNGFAFEFPASSESARFPQCTKIHFLAIPPWASIRCYRRVTVGNVQRGISPL